MDCEESFEKLKETLTRSPVLCFPIFDKNVTFYLSTDASTVAIGYILSQKVNGQDRVIAYGGRNLKSCETRYSICELELLSLTEGVKHFRQYLTHQKFYIITDHKSIIYMNQNKFQNPKLYRYSLELEGYNFEILFRPGVINTADALSRRRYDEENIDEDRSKKEINYTEIDDILPSIKHLVLDTPVETGYTGKTYALVSFICEGETNAILTRQQKRKQKELVVRNSDSLVQTRDSHTNDGISEQQPLSVDSQLQKKNR